MMAEDTRTVEELKDELRARDLPVSGTKEELLARLDETPEVTTETAAEAIDKLEEAVTALADNWTDTGDGAAVHIANIRSAVQGLRDSQRAWAHLTQSPVSAGEARG